MAYKDDKDEQVPGVYWALLIVTHAVVFTFALLHPNVGAYTVSDFTKCISGPAKCASESTEDVPHNDSSTSMVSPASREINLTCMNESGKALTVSENITLICKTNAPT